MKTTKITVHAEQLINAIIKDAIMNTAVLDTEEKPSNELHRKCISLIGEACNAQEACDTALERLQRCEDAFAHGDFSSINRIAESLEPLANTAVVILELFGMALQMGNADERMTMYGMADYIASMAEAK